MDRLDVAFDSDRPDEIGPADCSAIDAARGAAPRARSVMAPSKRLSAPISSASVAVERERPGGPCRRRRFSPPAAVGAADARSTARRRAAMRSTGHEHATRNDARPRGAARSESRASARRRCARAAVGRSRRRLLNGTSRLLTTWAAGSVTEAVRRECHRHRQFGIGRQPRKKLESTAMPPTQGEASAATLRNRPAQRLGTALPRCAPPPARCPPEPRQEACSAGVGPIVSLRKCPELTMRPASSWICSRRARRPHAAPA